MAQWPTPRPVRVADPVAHRATRTMQDAIGSLLGGQLILLASGIVNCGTAPYAIGTSIGWRGTIDLKRTATGTYTVLLQISFAVAKGDLLNVSSVGGSYAVISWTPGNSSLADTKDGRAAHAVQFKSYDAAGALQDAGAFQFSIFQRRGK